MTRGWLVVLGVALTATLPARAGNLQVTLRDQTGAAVADAAVILRADTAGMPVAGSAQIDQIDKRFVPAVSLVPTGTAISFPNKDNIRHHVYSFSPARTFELKLYSGVPSAPVEFPEPGLVVLGCNIHDGMIAYIYVVDTPYAALSDREGRATLEGLAAARYQLEVWHPRLREPAIIDAALDLGDAARALEPVLTLEPLPTAPPPLE